MSSAAVMIGALRVKYWTSEPLPVSDQEEAKKRRINRNDFGMIFSYFSTKTHNDSWERVLLMVWLYTVYIAEMC